MVRRKLNGVNLWETRGCRHVQDWKHQPVVAQTPAAIYDTFGILLETDAKYKRMI